MLKRCYGVRTCAVDNDLGPRVLNSGTPKMLARRGATFSARRRAVGGAGAKARALVVVSPLCCPVLRGRVPTARREDSDTAAPPDHFSRPTRMSDSATKDRESR